ncbi:MAG TPA: tyrosine-type recombinase/integrase [Leptolyngbyaceae cyanobacterium]
MGKVSRKGQAAVLSRQDLRRLWAELPNPHRWIAQFSYYTGSRIGEVLALKSEAIQGDRILIWQDKVRRSKDLLIAPPLKSVIKQLPIKGGFLFPSSRNPGRHISRQAFDDMLRNKCDYLGLEGVSSHSFRRSLATHLYRAEYDIRSIMEITGHTSLDSFVKYLDLNKDAADKIIATYFSRRTA